MSKPVFSFGGGLKCHETMNHTINKQELMLEKLNKVDVISQISNRTDLVRLVLELDASKIDKDGNVIVPDGAVYIANKSQTIINNETEKEGNKNGERNGSK